MNIDHQDVTLPVYAKYPNEIDPQPAQIEMDEEGNFKAAIDWNTGGAVSRDEWHGVTTTIAISPYTSKEGIEEIGRRFDERLKALHEAHSIYWDDQSNKCGMIDVDFDFHSLEEDILAVSHQYDIQVIQDVEEWFYDVVKEVTDEDGDPIDYEIEDTSIWEKTSEQWEQELVAMSKEVDPELYVIPGEIRKWFDELKRRIKGE